MLSRRAKGFTILELLIYTAIVGMTLVSMIFVTQTMYDIRARVRTSALVREHVGFVLTRAMSSVRQASAVTLPVGGSATSTLELVTAVTSTNPTVFLLRDGRVYLKEGASEELPLTSDEIEITGLLFTCSEDDPPLVHAEISGDRRNAEGFYTAPLTLTGAATVRRE